MIQLRVSRKRNVVLMATMAFAVLLIMSGWIVYSRLVGAYSGPGAGTAGDPYIVFNCVQLQEMNDDLSADYALGADIDCEDTINWNEGTGFIPIGAASSFSGNFDGRDYSISNLYIVSDGTFTGLFSSVQSSLKSIKNVTIKDSTITGMQYVGAVVGYFYGGDIENVRGVDNEVTGTDMVGGLVGFSYRTQLLETSSTGSVSGAQKVGGLVGQMTQAGISRSMSGGEVEGSGASVGGLLGYFDGHAIYDSYSTANVTGTNEVGGLIGTGKTDGNFTVRQTYASGNVTTTGSPSNAGGLIGLIDMSGSSIENIDIQDSFSVSPVELSFAGSAGGLIGELFNQPETPFDPNLSTDYYDGDATGTAACVADGTSSTCNEVNSDGSDPDYFKGSDADYPLSAWDFDTIWLFKDANSLPTLGMEISANFAGGDGTEGAPYVVRSCVQLQAMQMALAASYELDADIDCSATATWNGGKGFDPIGDEVTPFTGSFDGDDNTITGLTIVRADDLVADSGTEVDEWYVGLFGYADGATLQNLHLENTKSKGYEYVGGIVGYMQGGTLSGSSVNVEVDNDENAECGAGEYCVWARYGIYGGGLVGFAYDTTISDSHTGGPVKGSGIVIGGLVGELNSAQLENSTSTSNVDGGTQIGGAVGYAENGSTIERVTASGDVSAKLDDLAFKPGYLAGGLVASLDNSTVLISSASGNVHADVESAGGLVAAAQSSDIEDSYATGDVDTGFEGSYGHKAGGLIGAASFSHVERSYASGNVTAVSDNAGGLIGELYSGSVTESFAIGDVSAPAGKGRFVGQLGPVVDGVISDSYYDGTGTGDVYCASDGGVTSLDPEGCTPIEGQEVLVGYFFDYSNAPFTVDDERIWSNSIWYFDGESLPVHSTATSAPRLISPAPDPDTDPKYYKDVDVELETYSEPLSGSMELTLVPDDEDMSTVYVHLDDLSPGKHEFTLHADNLLLDSNVVSASQTDIPEGSYTVTFSYRDIDDSVTLTSTAHNVYILQKPIMLCEAPYTMDTTLVAVCTDVPSTGWGTTTWEGRYGLRDGDEYTTVTPIIYQGTLAVISVQDLTPGTWYRVEFRFTNNAGVSEWGHQDILTTGTAPVVDDEDEGEIDEGDDVGSGDSDDPKVVGIDESGGIVVTIGSGNTSNAEDEIIVEKDDTAVPHTGAEPATNDEKSGGNINGTFSFWDWWWWILIVIGVVGFLIWLSRSANKSK